MPLLSPALAAVLLGSCDRRSGKPARILASTEAGHAVLTIDGLFQSDWPVRELLAIDTLLAPETSEPALVQVSAAAMGEGGRIAVLDGTTREAWVRPGPGRTWVRVASEGDGPAELRSATGAWWVGDTLSILDARRSRLLRLADGMAPIGTGVPLPGTRQSAFGGVPYGDGKGFLAVLLAHPDLLQTEGTQRPELSLVWVPIVDGSAGPQTDTLGRWPGRVWAIPSQGGIALLPFGADTHVDASAGGIAVADGALPGAWALGFDGRIRAEIRWEDPPRPVSEKMPGFLETSLEELPPPAEPAVRAMLESLPYPENLPYTGGVMMGMDEVWLAEWFGTEVENRGSNWPAVEWRAVRLGADPGVTRITTPEGVMPLQILSPEAVVVLLEDDLERQGVGIAHLGEGEGRDD